MQKFMRPLVAAVTIIAAPSVAIAGTSTATGTATFNVVNQCAVTGTTVNLGSYLTTDTPQTIGQRIGYYDDDTFAFVAGANGIGSVNLGSVTCDNGTPYTVAITGSNSDKDIKVNVGNEAVLFQAFIKKIGNTTMADGWAGSNYGGYGNPNDGTTSATGSGVAQPIMGNIIPLVQSYGLAGFLERTQPLGAAGNYSDSLTYTLSF